MERARAALRDAGLIDRREDGLTVDDVLIKLDIGPRVLLLVGQPRSFQVDRHIRPGRSVEAAVQADTAEVASEAAAALARAGLHVDEEALAQSVWVTVATSTEGR